MRRKTEAWLVELPKANLRAVMCSRASAVNAKKNAPGTVITPLVRRDAKAEAVVRAAVRWYHNGRLLRALEKAVIRYEKSRKRAKR